MENREEIVIDGAVLKAARLTQQRDLADLARELCMSSAQIKQIEDGGERSFYHFQHKISCIRKYTVVLGVPVEEVLTKPAPSPEPTPAAKPTAPAVGVPAAAPAATPSPATSAAASATASSTASTESATTSVASSPAAPVAAPAPAPVPAPADLGAEFELEDESSEEEDEDEPLTESELTPPPAAREDSDKSVAEAAHAEEVPARQEEEAEYEEAPSERSAFVPALISALILAGGWFGYHWIEIHPKFLRNGFGAPAVSAHAPADANAPAPQPSAGDSTGSAGNASGPAGESAIPAMPATPTTPTTPPAGQPAANASVGSRATPAAAPASAAQAAAEPESAAAAAATTTAETPTYCKKSRPSAVDWRPVRPRKPGDYVYLRSAKALTICVTDADGRLRDVELSPGTGRVFPGKSPIVVYGEKLGEVEVFFQGGKVRLPADALAVRLLAQPVVEEATAN